MKSRFFYLTSLFALPFLFISCNQQMNRKAHLDSLGFQLDAKRLLLPNGWSLSSAGKSLPLGDLPLNLVVSPSGKFMAVTKKRKGKHTITIIDPSSQKNP